MTPKETYSRFCCAQGCWEAGQARADQAARETLAISLALEALAPHLQNHAVLHLTDSQPALDSLREAAGRAGGGMARVRGRSRTRDSNSRLHTAAAGAHACAARHGVCVVSVWVSGDWVNRLGADALSRPTGDEEGRGRG